MGPTVSAVAAKGVGSERETCPQKQGIVRRDKITTPPSKGTHCSCVQATHLGRHGSREASDDPSPGTQKVGPGCHQGGLDQRASHRHHPPCETCEKRGHDKNDFELNKLRVSCGSVEWNLLPRGCCLPTRRAKHPCVKRVPEKQEKRKKLAARPRLLCMLVEPSFLSVEQNLL